jgi:UrcA family protein
MKNIGIKSTLSAAGAACCLGMAMNAKAGQLDEAFVHALAVPTATVSFSRAKLATDEGRAAAEHRIREAAKQVCGPLDTDELAPPDQVNLAPGLKQPPCSTR